MKRLLLNVGSLLLLLSLQAANATIHVVTVGNFFFSPPSVTVDPGDTVRWVLGAGVHTSTSTLASTKAWDSGILGAGGFNVQFVLGDGPGPFPYICAVHSLSMSGSVTVTMPPASQPTYFPFLLDESEEALCAGTGSTAKGYGFAILSPDSTNLSLYVAHDVSAPTAAHIHKAAICTDGSPVFPFASPISPISQGFAVTPGNVADLYAGLFYVNVHSGAFPGGEIRGQIIPEPIRFLFALDEAQEVPPTASLASGCAEVELSADGKELSVHIEHDVRNVVGGHIHMAPPGADGGIVFPFADPLSPVDELWAIDTTSVKNLLNGQLYANIHSTLHTDGEIRGQVVRDSLLWVALLDGRQANGGAGTGSAFVGFGVFKISADQKTLEIHVEHNLPGPIAGHIHFGRPNIEGGIVFPFASSVSPIIETWDISSVAHVDSLLAGALYVNIHSVAFPAGEIRGQILDQAVQFSSVLDEDQEALCVGTGSAAFGSALITLKPCGQQMTIDATHNVALPIDAHIHMAPVCVIGPPIFPFTSPVSPIRGNWYLGTSDVLDFFQHELYINVHSTPFPAGEIRAQLETCCLGGRGDVNYDGTNSNILDLTFLVDRIFRGGRPASCPEEADCNGDGTTSNILDLTFLVDRIFRGGPACGPCRIYY